MEKQFICYKKFGLGFVYIEEQGILQVDFVNGTKYVKDDPSFYKILPPQLVDTIAANKPSEYFNFATLNKSESYCNSSTIEDITITNNQITAIVKGTHNYQVNIEFNFTKSSIIFSCNCPVRGECKHEAALYSYFYNFISLKKYHQDNPILDKNLDEFASNFFSLKAFKQLITTLSSMTYENAKTSYEYICIMPIDLELKAVISEIICVFYEDDQKELVQKLKYLNYEVMKANYNMFYPYSTNTPSRTLIEIMVTDFVKDEFYNFVSTFLSIKDGFSSEDVFDKIFEVALSNCSREEKDSILFKLNAKNFHAKNRFKNLVLKNYDNLQYAKYMFMHSENINQNVFNLTDTKTFFELIDYVDKPVAIYPYVKTHVIELYAENRVKTIQVFHQISMEATIDIYHDLLELVQTNFPNEPFINTVKNIRRQREYYEIQNINFNRNKRIDYFDVNYNLSRNDTSVVIHYYAFLENKTLLMDFIEIIDGISTNSKISYNTFNEDFIDELISKIKEVLNQYLEDEINQEMNAINKLIDEKYQKMLEDKFNTFISKNMKQSISVLKEDSKASFLISISEIYSNCIQLSLKIGNKKFYMIKNINDFISRFERHLTYRYGKDLELYHDDSNLTPEARELLDFLIREGKVYSDHRDIFYIYVRSYDRFFSLLKNQVINIDKAEYLVKLDPIDFTIKIDEYYHIRVSGFEINDKIIFSNSNAYIIRHDKKVIDLIKLKQGTLDLLKLAVDINNYDIKSSKDLFISNIYSCYPECIEIDEKIKNEFKTSLMTIKTYFDYTNKVITVRSEFTKNEQAIKLDNLEYNDRLLFTKYSTTLSAMGVKENIIEDEDNIYAFFNMDFTEFKIISEVYLSESIMNKRTISFTNQKLKVDYHSNTMSVFYEDSSYSDEELYELYKAIKHKRNFYILKNNVIVDLNNDEARNFYQLVNDLNLNEKKLTKAEEKPLYQSFKLLNYSQKVTMDDFILKMIHDISHYKEAKFEPPLLNAKYRKYQVEGYLWLKTLVSYNLGGILADDMGLGKTLEIIMLLCSDKTSMPSLIVCPKSLIFNWKSEFMKFASDVQVIEIYGNNLFRQNTIQKINPSKKVIYLTSYDSLRNDEEYYKNKSFAYLIIDEGQYIKNAQSQKSQVVKRIKSKYKFALTGTPIENNIYDLWSLFDFLMPNYLENIETFKSAYSKNQEYVQLIAKKVAPFILRRTKSDVLKDLPNKYERIVTSEMNEAQRKLYDAHILQAKEILALGGKAFDILPMLMRLRQICVDPSTFISNYEKGSGKIDMLLSIVDEYITNGHRILVFSQFVSALNIVASLLKKKQIKYYMLTGDTKSEERLKLCNSFNNDENIKVFLISLKAGGTGLNLIGADTIIHLDPWWNVAAENQASDRAHRIGQTRNVEVIKLICRDSIEQRVIELQNIKKDLISKLISNDDSSITKMRKEDLEYILK